MKMQRFYLIFFLCALCVLCGLNSSCAKQNNLGGRDIYPVGAVWGEAQRTAASMNDSLLAAQVIITAVDGRGALSSGMKTLLRDIPAGGVMLFSENLNTDINSIRALITETSALITEYSRITPFVTIDHEGGTINRFQRGVADLPSAASYRRRSESEEAILSLIYQDASRSGQRLASLGFNMNFAPVAEYLNADNRFLINRSYGTDPYFTAKAASAFFHGMKDAGIMCVVKHFPGHSGQDPHYNVSVLNMNINSLKDPVLAEYVYPFSDLISNDVRAVMLAHTLIPAIDNQIAPFSSVIMNDWLRGELGFKGLIITDDLIMAAVGTMRPEEAAVKSVIAGADMVLIWPKDLRRTHTALMTALENGELPRKRLEEAVSRIVYEKMNNKF